MKNQHPFWRIWLCLSASLGFVVTFAPLAGALEVKDGNSSQHPGSDQSIFQDITFGPLTPACPLPPVPVSDSTINDLLGFNSLLVMAVLENTQESDRFSIRANGTDPTLHPEINQLLGQRQIGEALALAQSFEDETVRNENLLAVSRAFLYSGSLTEALTAALAMTEQPFEGKSPFVITSLRDQALDLIFQSYQSQGQLEASLQIAEVMSESGRFSALVRVMEAYQRQGQQAEALALLEQATLHYRNLARLSESSDILRFWSLAKLLELYLSLPEGEQRTEAAALGAELFTLVQALPSRDYLILNALVDSVAVYDFTEQAEQIMAVLSFAQQEADNLTEPYLHAMVLAGIAHQYGLLGEGDRIPELMTQAEALVDIEDDTSQRDISRVIFAVMYYHLTQPENAFQIALDIESSTLREQIQQTLTCAQNP